MLERMNKGPRIVIAWFVGTGIFAVALVLIDRLYWAKCSGVNIQRYNEMWVCGHVLDIHLAGSCVAGIAAGFLSRGHGLAVGALVAIAGLAIVSVAYQYPFGPDHLAALKNGLLYFVLPSALACVLGARLTGGTWRNAL